MITENIEITTPVALVETVATTKPKRKPVNHKHAKPIGFRFTPEEKAHLEVLAKVSNITQADVLRKLISATPLPTRKNEIEEKFLQQLMRIGGNLNQANAALWTAQHTVYSKIEVDAMADDQRNATRELKEHIQNLYKFIKAGAF